MKYFGWALLIAGAAGAYYRYTLYQSSQQGNPALANASLKTFDPASLLGLNPGTGLFDLPMGLDVATALIGLALATGRIG